MTDERHGFISASGLGAAADCNGMWHATKDIEEPEASPEATLGTRVHSLMAGETVENVTDEEMDIYQQLIRKKRTLVARFFDKKMSVEIKEQRMELRDPCLAGNVFTGKPDLVLGKGKEWMILDYKTGWGEYADSATNKQLRALAVLLADQKMGVDVVHCAIVQANKQPSVVSYTKNDLKDARAEVLRILTACLPEDATRTPSVSACRYCKARPTCPEANGQVRELAAHYDGVIKLNDLPHLITVAKMAEHVIKDIYKAARKALKNDSAAIKGWRLKDGAKRRSIEKPKHFRDSLLNERLLNADELGQLPVSLASVVQAYAKKCGIPKKEAERIIKEKCGVHIKESQDQPSIVKDKNDD